MSEAIGDPTQAVVLFTVEPVTHPGFFPVKINADANTPRYRQSLDVVGYGSNRMWNESLEDKKYPREAYVKRVQASRDELCPFSSSREFCAADFGRGGPCEGTSCVDAPSSRSPSR